MGFHGDTHHDLILFQISVNSSFLEQTKCTQQIGNKMLEDMSNDCSKYVQARNPTNKFLGSVT